MPFHKTIILTEISHLIYSCILQSVRKIDTDKPVFHRTGQNIEQVKFREALLRLHTYSTTPEEYALLSTQFWDILTPALWAEFDDVLHLLPTHASVLEFNCHKLIASAKPALHCHTKHNHAEASKVKSDDAEGLERDFLLAEGAKVMPNCNLWTSKG
jgi:hypothetical protein